MTKGRSIRLFLVDGTPGGIITAEIMGWVGHVMTAPRSRLPDLIRRDEAKKTGIYFLLGDDPVGGHKPMLYVGESDVIDERLRVHNKEKDFWDRVCVVTSKDHNLTKAHAKYLESRLIAIATESGRVVFDNGTTPEYARLPESDVADMEFFIEQLRVVLPVLGLELLKEPAKVKPVTVESPPPGSSNEAESPSFELTVKKHGLKAEAREIDGEFVVLAGSQAQAAWIGTTNHHYRNLHQQLVDDGVLVSDASGHLRFLRPYGFKSPSAAGAVVTGRATNGRWEWQVKGSKKSYADWKDEQIAATPQDQEGEA